MQQLVQLVHYNPSQLQQSANYQDILVFHSIPNEVTAETGLCPINKDSSSQPQAHQQTMAREWLLYL